jgi:putative transposase
MSSIEIRRAYKTDLSDAQWSFIEGLVPPVIDAGRPREVNFREIINAILYRTRTGCQWDLLPHDLPPKSTVFEYYRKWQGDGTWEKIHHALREKTRLQAGKQPEATVAILDSQSVKGTEFCEQSGFDAGKKIKGRKRHLLVDTLGLVIAVVITLASVQDRDGAKLVFASAAAEPMLQKVFADAGYSGKLIDWTKDRYPWALEIVKRPSQSPGFVLLSMRWIVERTFGWLNRSRLLAKENERTMESSTSDIHIAMSHLMLKRLDAKPKPHYPNEQLIAKGPRITR